MKETNKKGSLKRGALPESENASGSHYGTLGSHYGTSGSRYGTSGVNASKINGPSETGIKSSGIKAMVR